MIKLLFNDANKPNMLSDKLNDWVTANQGCNINYIDIKHINNPASPGVTANSYLILIIDYLLMEGD